MHGESPKRATFIFDAASWIDIESREIVYVVNRDKYSDAIDRLEEFISCPLDDINSEVEIQRAPGARIIH